MPAVPVVAKAMLHQWEEPCLVAGAGAGAGAAFFVPTMILPTIETTIIRKIRPMNTTR